MVMKAVHCPPRTALRRTRAEAGPGVMVTTTATARKPSGLSSTRREPSDSTAGASSGAPSGGRLFGRHARAWMAASVVFLVVTWLTGAPLGIVGVGLVVAAGYVAFGLAARRPSARADFASCATHSG